MIHARSIPQGGGGVLLAGILLLTLPLVNPYIRGDGNGYYAYVRSVVIDGDLQFENEYRRGDPAFLGVAFDTEGKLWPDLVTPTHHVRNQWAVGPALLWAPWFLAAHGTVKALDALGHAIPADGYSPPYRWLCAVGTAAYGFAGLLLAYVVAKQFTSPLAALMATIGIWFASPLPVYMYFLPFHVHALAAFSVSLFVWYSFATPPPRSRGQWTLWGVIGGLMVEVYYLDAIFFLLPLLELARAVGKGVARRRAHHSPGVWMSAAAFGAGALAASIPHFVVKWIIHGSPLDTGYRDRFFWTSPRLWEVGFAPEHGMFLWTPVLILATVGLGLLWLRQRRVTGPLLITFAVFYYAVASYENWHGQSAFGSRFFVSFTPVFVLGLAELLDRAGALMGGRVPSAAPRVLLVPGLALLPLVLWNIGFIFQWGTNLVPNRGPVEVSVVARNQVNVVPQRMAGFLGRYLRDREQVTREVEQDDLAEVRDYRVRR